VKAAIIILCAVLTRTVDLCYWFPAWTRFPYRASVTTLDAPAPLLRSSRTPKMKDDGISFVKLNETPSSRETEVTEEGMPAFNQSVLRFEDQFHNATPLT
jgi:hypothetical protein